MLIRPFSTHPRLLRGPRGTLIPSLKKHDGELASILKAEIAEKGPLTMASYMDMCLSYPQHGYYMRKDVFGREGDFITSPEISQLFGEMVGVWVTQAWIAMNRPNKWSLIEIGPGRGTLTMDVVKTLRDLNAHYGLNTHLVDVSSELKKIQQNNIKRMCEKWGLFLEYENSPTGEERLYKDYASFYWYREFGEVVARHLMEFKGVPTVIIAHELFDALPIHQFEFDTKLGWCERLVNVNPLGKFQIELTRGPNENVQNVLKPERRFSPVAQAALKQGDRIEVSPASMKLMNDICDFFMNNPGVSLIADYGDDRAFSNSLRGIKSHKKLSEEDWLQDPGEVDLSAYVNFSALRGIAESANMKVVGSIPQGAFLECMGISARVEMLSAKADLSTAKKLEEEYERLVSPEHMGEIYRMLYVGHPSLNEIYPFLASMTFTKK
jgi:NADH dehydrogenase [ubiquinone] 1 alpha subcomplex assembly factor 7